jgi:hypothetical protein
MPFHRSQLGRFGAEGSILTNMMDPDQKAANVVASNGKLIGPRPSLDQVLAAKGFWERTDPQWRKWVKTFGTLRNTYMGNGGGVLQSRCPTNWPGYPSGLCLHELTPPLLYGNFRWFGQRVGSGGLPDNVQTRGDGTLGIDPASKPIWNFVVTSEGEILTGSEDYELIKHTCLAAGLDIWSAGELGILKRRLRLINLQSGHYVFSNVGPGTQLAVELVNFTKSVFVGYAKALRLICLDSKFECVWG